MPTCRDCLPRFSDGGFKFLCLPLGKKSYLLHFSFKFNEVKFFALFMNWIIQKKNFTNLIINLGLRIACVLWNVLQKLYYSHISVCCRRSVAPWITILSQHALFTTFCCLQIHFRVIFRETRHHAQAHVTLGALEDRVLSLAAGWT
jgi:hypothetical protein